MLSSRWTPKELLPFLTAKAAVVETNSNYMSTMGTRQHYRRTVGLTLAQCRAVEAIATRCNRPPGPASPDLGELCDTTG
jgi:hypothetical protein